MVHHYGHLSPWQVGAAHAGSAVLEEKEVARMPGYGEMEDVRCRVVEVSAAVVVNNRIV